MTKLTKKRFVISKSLIGQNVEITFTTKKGTFTYNHDDVYSINQEKLETMECFQKYGNNLLSLFVIDYRSSFDY